ncbi:MAG: ABC transporter ATP-binding protein [Deltaproteobacteria bacterium]|nr:ABC transporter ATP-binding protein [Deltaproteobacteria bacterium]
MITIQNLAFSYPRKKLFSGLDLELSAGGICGLLGKNGAGKTTLLKLLAGLAFPHHGDILVAGHRPGRRSPALLQDLFLVPEEFSLPAISPLKYQQLFAPFYPHFSADSFAAHLDEFELDARTNMRQCSFGQRKKCFLAFALAASCRLTLLDEPTNGLDIPSKSQFRRALASVFTDDRLFIIATHQVRDLESIIDPVVILDAGRIIFNRTTAEIDRGLEAVLQAAPPSPETTLYSEKTLEGYRVVRENVTGTETRMDLELLFNTVIQNHEKVATLFKRRSAHAS